MYVYWWHALDLRAVKVGHGNDPRELMASFCKDWGLSGEDLRSYKLDDDIDVEWVEGQLRRLLQGRGFYRITPRRGAGTQEFFSLGARTFDDAHDLLLEASRHMALAEASNLRKEQMRLAGQPGDAQGAVPQASRQRDGETPRRETHQAQQPASPSSPLPLTRRPWPRLIGAAAMVCLLMALAVDEWLLGTRSARLDRAVSEQTPPLALAPAGETRAAAEQPPPPAQPEQQAPLPASPPQPQAQPQRQAEPAPVVPPPSLLQPQPPTPPPPDRPQPPSQPPAAPRQAAPPAQPSLAAPRQTPKCTVSRPKPGFQVYLVTCPNSWAKIGRTVNLPNGWTVSEGTSPAEAVEFFMKSQYAR
jgi:hypothetical protein